MRAALDDASDPPSAEKLAQRPARSARQAPTPPRRRHGKNIENPRGCNGESFAAAANGRSSGEDRARWPLGAAGEEGRRAGGEAGLRRFGAQQQRQQARGQRRPSATQQVAQTLHWRRRPGRPAPQSSSMWRLRPHPSHPQGDGDPAPRSLACARASRRNTRRPQPQAPRGQSQGHQAQQQQSPERRMGATGLVGGPAPPQTIEPCAPGSFLKPSTPVTVSNHLLRVPESGLRFSFSAAAFATRRCPVPVQRIHAPCRRCRSGARCPC